MLIYLLIQVPKAPRCSCKKMTLIAHCCLCLIFFTLHQNIVLIAILGSYYLALFLYNIRATICQYKNVQVKKNNLDLMNLLYQSNIAYQVLSFVTSASGLQAIVPTYSIRLESEMGHLS